MAYNPKGNSVRAADYSIPVIGQQGKPAVVISRLQKLEEDTKRELSFRTTEMSPAKISSDPKRPKKSYYIEWWNLGTDSRDIRCGQCETSDIRYVCRRLMAGEKRSIVYIKDLSENRVLWNRRANY